MTYLEEHAKEKSTYIVPVSFKDPDLVAVTPNAGLTWTLTDIGGNVINSRSQVAISAASTINIVLTGNDLIIRPNNELVILVEGTFNSVTYGNNLPIKDEIHFFVDDLIKVAN